MANGFNLPSFVSYIPIPLFGESFRVHRAILSAISDPLFIPTSVTGCIKDLGCLWHLDAADVFSEAVSHKSLPHVASLRHGNNFPLANCALLEHLGLLQRRITTPSSGAKRPTTVNVTFLCPRLKASHEKPRARRSMLTVALVKWAQVVTLFALAASLYQNGLYMAAALVLCVGCSTLILVFFHLSVSTHLGDSYNILEDTVNTAQHGAGLDVHVVVPHWNPSQMHVLVGYSSQLHALTNLPPRLFQSRHVWALLGRALAVILSIQAALLTSLAGTDSDQVWGTAIWLAVYLAMQVPPWVTARLRDPAESLLSRDESHGVQVRRVPPLSFSGRRAALAFITALPVGLRVSRWVWVDPFIPANDRRRAWEEEVEKTGIFAEPGDSEAAMGTGAQTPPGKWEQMLAQEVRGARSQPGFLQALFEYEKAVGLRQGPE